MEKTKSNPFYILLIIIFVLCVFVFLIEKKNKKILQKEVLQEKTVKEKETVDPNELFEFYSSGFSQDIKFRHKTST